MIFKEIINQELCEERFVPEGKKHILLCDIDDTLLSASGIFIWKKVPNEKEIPLTPEQFAKENIKEEEANGVKYDMREFRTPHLVSKSIENGKVIWKNVKLLNDHIKKGWEVGILTARGLEDVIYDAMNKWAMFRKNEGLLETLYKPFTRGLVHAVHDDVKIYNGANSFEKKANVIKKYAKTYDKVKFIDDDMKNIEAVRNLKLPNVTAVIAWPKE